MTELTAVYYDGETSEGRSVQLRLDELQQLHLAGLSEPLSFPLERVRISPRLGNTTRSLHLPNGAKCESDDHAALDELERQSGQGALGRAVHLLESRWRYAALAGVLLVLVLLGGARWGIPLLARRIADAVPARMAFDLGRGTLEVLDRTWLKPSELKDDVQARLEQRFQGMAEKYPALPLHLMFRRGVGPNAFALPDGTVVATDELVALAHDDEEVMAVLAHEIGHVHHRHGLRMALQSSTVLLLVSAYLGDVTQLTTLSTALPGVYATASYSRELETEADTFALAYLDQNGIPHRRFADILRALQAHVGADPDRAMQYLASHPPTSERIARFEK